MYEQFDCCSLEEALERLRAHEIETNSRFAVYTCTKDFGKSSIHTAKNVYWEDRQSVKTGRMDFCGVPFIVLGTKTFDCQFGKDRKKKAKEKRKALKRDNDHDRYQKGKKFLLSDTKKLNCEARCVMREICKFPSYTIADNSSATEKKNNAEDLLCRLRAGQDIHFKRYVITCLPHDSQHSGHPVGPSQVLPQEIDPRVSQKIKQLVKENMLDPGVLRSQICAYVKTICDPVPHPTNKRFYPCDKTIRNHLYMAKNEKLSDDQTKLEAWVRELKKTTNDFIFCRLKSDLEEHSNDTSVVYGSKFLFVYQTQQQRRLLSKYGCTVLLDATYKTTLYDLPLFFIAVKTNVDYQVVGCFITEDETSEAIAEALTVLQSECFDSEPPYFLTDFDESEISAVEKVFKGTRVLICDFHRQQAWERWTSKKSNCMEHKDEILNLLRNVAMAADEKALEAAVKHLRSTHIWNQNIKLQNYFNKVWFPHHQRWCKAFRIGDINIVAGTTNGIESQHKIFKTSFMHRKTTYSLFSMLNILVKDFFPSRYKGYVDMNQMCSGKFKKYSADIPEQLYNRPKRFVKHCLERIDSAKDIESNDVKKVSDDVFSVVSNKRSYAVMLGNENSMPHCDCNDWTSKHLPCIHMFSVMSIHGDISWDLLSPLYMQSVYCSIDEECILDIDPAEGKGVTVNQEQEDALLATDDEESNITSVECHQRKARDVIKKLSNLTYDISSIEILNKIQHSVNNLVAEVDKKEPTIPSQSRFTPLRKRLSLKKYANRSGVKAAVLKKHSKLDISEATSSSSHPEIEVIRPYLPADYLPEQNTDLCNKVTKIWNRHTEEITPRTVGPFVITAQSIRCIKSFLCDEVIDSYLHEMVRRHQNGRILHVNCITMTAIFEGQHAIHHCLRKVEHIIKEGVTGVYLILKEIKSGLIGNVQHVQELSKEDQLLQQEKNDLKNSFCFQEKQGLYLEYLGKDRNTWPDVKQTDEKLKASREERLKVKNKLEEEKDKVYDILQRVKDEHSLQQEKVTKLEEKLKIFESKRKLFEGRRQLDPGSVDSAVSRCEQAIAKIEAEVSKQRAELEKRETDIEKMKAELKGQTNGSGAQEQSVERLEKVLKLLQNVNGVKAHVSGQEQITLEFEHHNPEFTSVTSPEESFNLEMTLTFNTGCHGDIRLSDVKISIDHFRISDIVDTAIAMNDVPFLVLSAQQRWTQNFPLLSEMDILNKNHAIDWIQEQCRLRVLVDKCGKIMFTLSVPKDYPSTREITLLDSYGIDTVDTDGLPDDATLLQWVLYLEKKYGDC